MWGLPELVCSRSRWGTCLPSAISNQFQLTRQTPCSAECFRIECCHLCSMQHLCTTAFRTAVFSNFRNSPLLAQRVTFCAMASSVTDKVAYLTHGASITDAQIVGFDLGACQISGWCGNEACVARGPCFNPWHSCACHCNAPLGYLSNLMRQKCAVEVLHCICLFRRSLLGEVHQASSDALDF